MNKVLAIRLSACLPCAKPRPAELPGLTCDSKGSRPGPDPEKELYSSGLCPVLKGHVRREARIQHQSRYTPGWPQGPHQQLQPSVNHREKDMASALLRNTRPELPGSHTDSCGSIIRGWIWNSGHEPSLRLHAPTLPLGLKTRSVPPLGDLFA